MLRGSQRYGFSICEPLEPVRAVRGTPLIRNYSGRCSMRDLAEDEVRTCNYVKAFLQEAHASQMQEFKAV